MSVFTFIRFISLTSAVGGVVGVVVRGAVCLFLPLLGSSLSRLVGVWGLLQGVLCVCFYLY